ncbi:MAG: thermonuclease family protein [Cocleimonas sp.]|jgi:micrococcal nuclease
MKCNFVLILVACFTAFSVSAGGGSGTEPADDYVYVKQIHNNYDGDTFRAYLGKKTYHEPIRIVGVDTPELKGQCDYEIEKAIIAKKFLKDVLSHANNIVLVNPGRDKYDRVLATVLVDGNDLSQMIIDSGHGRAWRGWRESWCE